MRRLLTCYLKPQRADGLKEGHRWYLDSGHRTLLVRFLKFAAVGGTGVVVNNLALFLLFQQFGLPLIAAAALSFELAVINNFLWNNRWTFGRKDISLGHLLRFNLVSLGGLTIGTTSLWVLVTHLDVYYLAANLLGIGLATAWNFVVNLRWTWG